MDQADSGMVMLWKSGPACSGTLLKNNWVLTAAHCVDVEYNRWFWIDDTRAGGTALSGDGLWEGTGNLREVRAVAIDSNNRTLVAGYYRHSSGNRLYLSRLLHNSSGGDNWGLDTSFDTDGVVTTDLPNSSSEVITDLAFQVDGKIVVTGYYTVSSSDRRMFVGRYTSAGVLDTTYGNQGVKTANFSGADEVAYSIDVDGTTGNAVIAGFSTVGGERRASLARFTSAGALDTTFDTDGMLTTDFGSSSRFDGVEALSDGIYATGSRGSGTSVKVAVARYANSGALDTAFSSDGKLTFGTNAKAMDIVWIASQVYIAGVEGGLAAVWNVKADGTMDTSFGEAGKATIMFRGVESSIAVGIDNTPEGDLKIAASVQLPPVGDAASVEAPAYANVSSTGMVDQNRYFPEATGEVLRAIGGRDTAASAVANSGTLMVVAGTTGSGSSTSHPFAISLYSKATGATLPSGAITVEMAGESVEADRGIIPDRKTDVALLHLVSGMTMDGSTTGYSFPGFAPVTGSNLTCMGYGHSEFDTDGDPSGAFEELRSGQSTITDVTDNYIVLDFGPNDQLPWAKDSGGSCVNGMGKIVGVNVRGSITEEPLSGSAMLAPSSKFASWAEDEIENP